MGLKDLHRIADEYNRLGLTRPTLSAANQMWKIVKTKTTTTSDQPPVAAEMPPIGAATSRYELQQLQPKQPRDWLMPFLICILLLLLLVSAVYLMVVADELEKLKQRLTARDVEIRELHSIIEENKDGETNLRRSFTWLLIINEQLKQDVIDAKRTNVNPEHLWISKFKGPV